MRILSFAIMLACAVPATAIPTTAAPDETSQQASGEAQFQAVVTAIFDDDQALATRRLDLLAKTIPDTDNARAIVLNLRAMIAARRGQEADARRLLDQSEKLMPDQADISAMTYLGFLGSDRLSLAGYYLDRMIARYPDKVRELDPDAVWPLLRDKTGEPKALVDDRAIALVRLGFDGSEGDYLAQRAAGTLLDRGDVAGAAALIRDVDDPMIVENMLIQRRFAPLWPAIEAQSGPHLARSLDSLVRQAEQAAAANPTDTRVRKNLVTAYRMARRYEPLGAIRAALPQTAAELAKADEQTGWVINELAYADVERGRPQDADRLFASLNAVTTENWRINMLINRIDLLVGEEQFARALPLIDEAEKVEKSPFADQLLRALRFCSQSRLGRTAEAAALRPALMTHLGDARGATIDSLLCAGDVAAAEKIALTMADKPSDQADFVRAMQPRPLTGDPLFTTRLWQSLRDLPSMKALYQRLGRDLPAELRVDTAGNEQRTAAGSSQGG